MGVPWNGGVWSAISNLWPDCIRLPGLDCPRGVLRFHGNKPWRLREFPKTGLTDGVHKRESRRFNSKARAGLSAIMNYVGGAFIYIRPGAWAQGHRP